MLVLAREAEIDDVRDDLGDDGGDVTFVALDTHGRNPSRITTMLHSFQAGAGGQRSVGVNDTGMRGRSPAALLEARYSDMVLNNVALRSWPMSVLCLYDDDTADDDGRRSMRMSHRVIRGEGENLDYQPDSAAAMYGAAVEPGPDVAARLEIDRADLAEMRSLVRDLATSSGASADRVDDLVLAANEIVTNSLRYGGGHARLAVWSAEGTVICEVRDRGHIRDPLAGRLTPPLSATSGRGLWLANHLCDLVQLRSSPAGTVVRMFLDL